MKLSHVSISIIVACILFFVGRWTSPETVIDHKEEIEALKLDVKISEEQFKIAVDSMNHYKILSNIWFNEAQNNRKAKTVTRTIYNEDTTRNRSMSVLERDSTIRAIFLKK